MSGPWSHPKTTQDMISPDEAISVFGSKLHTIQILIKRIWP